MAAARSRCLQKKELNRVAETVEDQILERDLDAGLSQRGLAGQESVGAAIGKMAPLRRLGKAVEHLAGNHAVHTA